MSEREPVFTQTLNCHMNGGRKFTVLIYDVLADGVRTGITRTKETAGAPRFALKTDVFVTHEGARFDVLATRGKGLLDWLRAHARTPAPEGTE